jgi:hypothetical protein
VALHPQSVGPLHQRGCLLVVAGDLRCQTAEEDRACIADAWRVKVRRDGCLGAALATEKRIAERITDPGSRSAFASACTRATRSATRNDFFGRDLAARWSPAAGTVRLMSRPASMCPSRSSSWSPRAAPDRRQRGARRGLFGSLRRYFSPGGRGSRVVVGRRHEGDRATLGEATVKTHVARILRKLGLRDRGPGRRPRLPDRPGCDAHEHRSLTRTSLEPPGAGAAGRGLGPPRPAG